MTKNKSWFTVEKSKQYEMVKDTSLLDAGRSMKLKTKLQKEMKWLENDFMHLFCFWENYILTWRWEHFLLVLQGLNM